MIAQSSIQLYVPFNGNNHDQSANPLIIETGTGTPTFEQGRIGLCATYAGDGSNYDRFSISGQGVPYAPTGAVTVSAWVRNNSNGAIAQHIFGTCNGGSSNSAKGLRSYFTADNRLFIRHHNGYSTSQITQATGIALNTWYHIAGTWSGINGEQAHLFLNGKLVDSQTVAWDRNDEPQAFHVAKRVDMAQYGEISIQHLYATNTILTASDAMRIYLNKHPLST